MLALYFESSQPHLPLQRALCDIYANYMGGEGTALEVIMVSGQSSQLGFSRAFRDQPWLAIPWSHAQRRERLAALYGVPADANRLVLLSADGQTISRDAAALVEVAHTCANAQAAEGKKGGELAEEERAVDAERTKLEAMRGALEPARLKAALAASALARQVPARTPHPLWPPLRPMTRCPLSRLHRWRRSRRSWPT